MQIPERPDKPNTFRPEDFPFDRLSLGKVGSFGYTKSTQFGTTHLNTYLVNKETGKLETYYIKQPALTSGPMSYYLPKDEATGKPKPDAKPSLYLRQNVHAQWAKQGLDGKPLQLPRGITIATFWKKWHTRVMELLRELSQQDLVALMGLRKSQQLEECLPELVQFGTYPDKHAKAGMPDEEHSPQFKSSPWIQERGRMKPDTLAKIEKQRPDEMLIIPGTDVHVYTAFYDNCPDSPCEGKRILGDWEPMKRFCYSRDRVDNASHQYAQVMARQTLQAPCLAFNPVKNFDGEIQCQPDEIVFTGYNLSSRDGSFTDEQMAAEKRKRQEDADELGFTQGGTELELAVQPAGAVVTKRFRNEDGSATVLENAAYGANDDDIQALGLQEEYDANQ